MLIQNISSSGQAAAPATTSGNAKSVDTAARTSSAAEVKKQDVAQQPSAAQLRNEVSKINTAFQQNNKNVELSFATDKSTNMQVVKLMDKETGDTLLQYPSEAVLAISRGIDEFQNGMLLKQKA